MNESLFQYRKNHIQSVFELSLKFEKEVQEAAEYHDVGYFHKQSGFHPVDGFLYVQDKVSKDISLAILWHGNAAELRPEELKHYYETNPLTERASEILKNLDYCDMRVDSRGNFVNPTQRWMDIRWRYGNHSKESVAFKNLMDKILPAKNIEIFLDVDGVLTDFYKYAYEVFGKALPTKREDWPLRGRKILEKLGADCWDDFFEKSFAFWYEMPKIKEGLELLNGLREMDIEPHILTSPAQHPVAISQRYAALQIEPFFCPYLTFCNEKHLLAASNRILIDDTPQNIEKWQRAGGIGVLWRQPWNSDGDFRQKDEVLEFVKSFL